MVGWKIFHPTYPNRRIRMAEDRCQKHLFFDLSEPVQPVRPSLSSHFSNPLTSGRVQCLPCWLHSVNRDAVIVCGLDQESILDSWDSTHLSQTLPGYHTSPSRRDQLTALMSSPTMFVNTVPFAMKQQTCFLWVCVCVCIWMTRSSHGSCASPFGPLQMREFFFFTFMKAVFINPPLGSAFLFSFGTFINYHTSTILWK